MGEDDEYFVEVGDTLLEDLRAYGGLRKRSQMVDIGCGYGRVAHALVRSRFLGDYRGFDILPRHIGWCVENLSGRRFRFEHLDIRNDRYNPDGRYDAATVDLQLQPGWADVILAASVFTHMWPGEVANYLKQVAPALARRGRAYLSFFLLNDSWQHMVDAGEVQEFPLPHRGDGPYRFMSPENPLHVIAYDQDWVEQQMVGAGLSVVSLRLGRWPGRDSDVYQDTFVVRRGI
jgi:SAM-dependent methyltransferase